MSESRFPLLAVLSTWALAGCGGGSPRPETPRPAPAPATVAAPVPPLVRAVPEVRMQLCALAPDSTTGLRTLDAVRRLDRPDTLALLGGKRVPLAEVVAGVPVAGEASWFAGGGTLDLTVGRRVQRYGIYDVPRIIPPSDLAYLGTTDKLPVYTAAIDIAPVRPDQVWEAVGTREIARLLEADAAFRARLRAIDVLYVPVRPIGCVFQPLLRAPTP